MEMVIRVTQGASDKSAKGSYVRLSTISETIDRRVECVRSIKWAK